MVLSFYRLLSGYCCSNLGLRIYEDRQKLKEEAKAFEGQKRELTKAVDTKLNCRLSKRTIS